VVKEMHFYLFLRIVVSLAFLLALFSSCTSAERSASSTDGRVAVATKSNVISLMALDDPTNPYRGQYRAWDYWVYENVGTRSAELTDKKPTDMTREELEAYVFNRGHPPNWTERKARVYESGVLVPYVVSLADFEQARASNTTEELAAKSRFVTASGEMDPQLKADMQEAGYAAQARFYPEIPEWLVNDPPDAAMLLPNGEIVTEGLLHEGDTTKTDDLGSKSGCCGGTGSIYARYDADGDLLAAKTGGWWGLYYDTDRLGKPEGNPVLTQDGYMKFFDESGALLSIWDYDGTKIGSEGEAVPRDPHYFTMATGVFWKHLYDAVHDK
jgi:hypothetical protein